MERAIPGDDVPTNRAETLAGMVDETLSFLHDSAWFDQGKACDAIDFTLGNPHDMPLPGLVEALREWSVPLHADWFAYRTGAEPARRCVAQSLRARTGKPFALEDVALTNGGMAAISLAMKAVADPDDEVIVNRPAWFNYGPIAVEAGLVPIDVALDRATFDIDVAAIEAAITPRTRVVVVNTPHNPTGRIVPVASLRVLAVALERAARREGRPIFILADEVYARIVFDGRESVSPAAVHPHCLIAYSYGKTLLAPGQRLGYLAVAPEASDRDALRRRITALQIATGWSFPDALMQYALPDLERLTIDIPHLQRKRDRLVRSLRAIGYCVEPPEGAFYLLPQSPWPDDLAFAKLLAGHGVLAMPGSLLGMPGHLRLSLTVSDEMIERSLPGFAAAWRDA